MSKLGKIFFGNVRFRESEEFQEYQYKFLIVLMVAAVPATLVFVLGVVTGSNPMGMAHVRSMLIFSAVTTVLWLALRGRKRWYLPVAWLYEVACLLEYASALAHVPEDELRILWLFTNVPGVYLLLGKLAGGLMTGVVVLGLLVGNAHLSAPYSPNAMATAVVGLVYLAVFFHVFVDRALSYFQRMHESNQKLFHLAMHDTLTGVFNARAYYEHCERLISLAKRAGTPYVVLFVDLDHFKSINDRYGHAAGDLVLKSVADCLRANLRRSDLLGRIGGEEFSIFLPNTDLEAGLSVSEEIRRAVAALMPVIADGRVLTITASIGAARNRHSDQTMQEIQQQADQAMYHAKSLGRNRVSTLDEPMEEGRAPLSV